MKIKIFLAVTCVFLLASCFPKAEQKVKIKLGVVQNSKNVISIPKEMVIISPFKLRDEIMVPAAEKGAGLIPAFSASRPTPAPVPEDEGYAEKFGRLVPGNIVSDHTEEMKQDCRNQVSSLQKVDGIPFPGSDDKKYLSMYERIYDRKRINQPCYILGLMLTTKYQNNLRDYRNQAAKYFEYQKEWEFVAYKNLAQDLDVLEKKFNRKLYAVRTTLEGEANLILPQGIWYLYAYTKSPDSSGDYIIWDAVPFEVGSQGPYSFELSNDNALELAAFTPENRTLIDKLFDISSSREAKSAQ